MKKKLPLIIILLSTLSFLAIYPGKAIAVGNAAITAASTAQQQAAKNNAQANGNYLNAATKYTADKTTTVEDEFNAAYANAIEAKAALAATPTDTSSTATAEANLGKALTDLNTAAKNVSDWGQIQAAPDPAGFALNKPASEDLATPYEKALYFYRPDDYTDATNIPVADKTAAQSVAVVASATASKDEASLATDFTADRQAATDAATAKAELAQANANLKQALTTATNGSANPTAYTPSPGTSYQLLSPFIAPGDTSATQSVATSNLAGYLQTLYRIGIGACFALGVIMFTWAGIEYILGESLNTKTDARNRINAALIGLAIALASYILLNTINPALLNFNAFQPPTAPTAGVQTTDTSGTSGTLPSSDQGSVTT